MYEVLLQELVDVFSDMIANVGVSSFSYMRQKFSVLMDTSHETLYDTGGHPIIIRLTVASSTIPI
jgi:hypothetical protein